MGVFSNNRPNIVPGALISSSYVSDLYDLLSGAKPESFVLSGSLSATGSLQGTASFATSASRSITASYANNALTASFAQNATSASFATTAATANVASAVTVQNTIGTGTYFLTMVDSQNIEFPYPAEIVNTQDISYNGFTGVLSFYNGQGTVQATASRATSASFATSASRSTSSSRAISANTADVASTVAVQGTAGSGNYFLTMVDSQNFSSTAELVNTQDLAYDGTVGVLSFFNGQGTIQATATSALTASYITASKVFGPHGANSILTASFAITASYALNAPSSGPVSTTEYIQIPLSDETNSLTTGSAKYTFRMPFNMTLTEVRASANVAPSGSTIIVDINQSGTSILSTKLSIDQNETTSLTAATPAVISTSALVNDAEITFDIDQVGSAGTTGKGLKILLKGTV